MAEPRTFCPSRQQSLFREGDVEEIPQSAFKSSYNLRVKQDEPLVNTPDSNPLTNHVSNLKPPYQKEYVTEEGEVLNHTLGLVSKSPNKKGSKSSPALKVYVRRKEWGVVNLEAHAQCSSHSRLKGKELVLGQSFNDNSKTDDSEGRDTHLSQPEGSLPNLQYSPHGPAPVNSANKELLANEEDFHMEIVRKLGVSYVEKNTTNDNMMAEATVSSGIFAPAEVMGMKHFES